LPKNSPPWVAYTELTALYFVQGASLGMWFVPLTSVLDAHGLQAIKPFVFATSGIAAFISPLFFGAMADRHASPVVVMRGLAVATATTMALASWAIGSKLNPWLVLAVIQLYQLCSSPAWSIASTVVFSGLRDATREFGPIRAVATLGWMAGCWLISGLGFDASARAGFCGALGWLVVAGMTFLLPRKAAPPFTGTVSLRERFGLDALALLKNSDHRVIFIAVALASIPMAAFYPYTPPHLRDLGLTHATSWMSLGQITELIAMMSLATMMARYRIKWVMVAGLVLGVVRFTFCALDSRPGVLAGVVLHGASYTWIFITAQIYLNERVDPGWRARAQALMSLTVSGVGNLAGYLGVGWWFAANTKPEGFAWPTFWLGLSAASVVVLLYFLIAYHGRGKSPRALQAGEA
jgi:MFS family permease